MQRTAVLDRLHAASDVPVISIVAPPGYGKTTVMGQFQAELERPSAWLTLDESDSDPVLLITSLTDALLSADLIDEEKIGDRPPSSDVLISGVTTLARALRHGHRGTLFLDQIDHLRTRTATDVIGALMTRLAGDLQVVVASRTGAELPLGILRSRASLVELSAADLAMDADETGAVFEAAGVDPGGQIDAVMKRTEGWPAGIYLTAMAMKAGSPGPDESTVHGDDIFIVDYLRQELLGQVPNSTMSFLLRTSVLTRLSGPLCDHLLQTTGSAETLSRLEEANLLIVPMDRTRTWYRYHSLMRDFLQSELERTHPEEVPSLHSRAATWLDEHGQTELAIDHVQLAGEDDRFADMVARSMRGVYAEGRLETLFAWLNALEEGKVLVDHPELAALGAFARGLGGDSGGADRIAMFTFFDRDGDLVDDADLGPFALMLRAYQAARGVEQAVADARAARAAFGNDAEFIHVCIGAEALATTALEGVQAAEPLWTDGIWRAESMKAHPFTTAALAERALAAIDRNDWTLAETWVTDSLERIAEAGLDRYITSALPFTLASRLATRAGDVDRARTLLASAMAVRPRFAPAMGLLTIQSLHEMSKAFIEVADVAGARRAMRDAADILAVRPRLGRFVTDHESLMERLSELPAGSVGASSLTKAELRLLPLLVTHLTYPEIGERLYVSRHTVKTQAMSIYRKLGVSSRADAVSKAREIGLISL